MNVVEQSYQLVVETIPGETLLRLVPDKSITFRLSERHNFKKIQLLDASLQKYQPNELLATISRRISNRCDLFTSRKQMKSSNVKHFFSFLNPTSIDPAFLQRYRHRQVHDLNPLSSRYCLREPSNFDICRRTLPAEKEQHHLKLLSRLASLNVLRLLSNRQKSSPLEPCNVRLSLIPKILRKKVHHLLV